MKSKKKNKRRNSLPKKNRDSRPRRWRISLSSMVSLLFQGQRKRHSNPWLSRKTTWMRLLKIRENIWVLSFLGYSGSSKRNKRMKIPLKQVMKKRK